MRHASLFSGIGGFDLAAQWMGWENIFQVEIDDFCQKVLAKNFPNVTRYGDIKQFDGTKYTGTIDVLTGGFPCQPFSGAGRRKGKNDARFVWPEMLRVIDEVRPKVICGENVAGILTMENGKTLERILTDLENLRFDTETFIIPACSVGTWHRRERIWIVAHDSGIGHNLPRVQETESNSYKDEITKDNRNRNGIIHETLRADNVLSEQVSSRNWDYTKNEDWNAEPDLGRMVYGVSSKLDKHRIKAIGNAIVPQVAFEIFKAIDYLRYK